MTPLVTVVIPTAGRPHLLPRAIESALALNDVQVIVIPNGPDESWKDALTPFFSDARVEAWPVEAAHANVARNAGLHRASGKYIRFLDDDDFLYEGASRQIERLEEAAAEICSGRVISVDSNLRHLKTTSFPITDDFVCAALSQSGFTLPIGNIFLRSALKDASWDDAVPISQDYVWMLHLASLREWNWVHSTENVGAWFHHSGSRISSMAAPKRRPIWMIEAILGLTTKLISTGRLTEQRKKAAAIALWHIAHHRFALDPFFSHKIGRQALELDCESRYAAYPLKNTLIDPMISPLLFEWLMLPKRLANHYMRSLFKSQLDNYFRDV